MKTYVILHGWGGDSHSNWFPSVKARLMTQGHNVFVPDFPNSEEPDYDEWAAHFTAEILPHVDSETVVIAHSLGCPFILRYISENKIPVGELHLVAPAPYDLEIPELKSFYGRPWNLLWIRESIKNIEIYGSDNDEYISLDDFQGLAEELRAKFHFLPNRGHLTDDTLPELLS